MNRILCFLPFFIQIVAQPFDYYWRDYFDEIPQDAFPGGATASKNPYYIAQAILPSGLYVSWLRPGDTSIAIMDGAPQKSELGIKVLCTRNPQNFAWVRTSHQTLNADAIGKHLVPSGTKDGKTLHIGRIWRQGEVLVGNIYEHGVDNNVLYFVQNNQGLSSQNYEVLVYNDDNRTVSN